MNMPYFRQIEAALTPQSDDASSELERLRQESAEAREWVIRIAAQVGALRIEVGAGFNVPTADEICCYLDELVAERDDLAERLRDLDEAHMVTVGRLATANAQLKRMQATR